MQKDEMIIPNFEVLENKNIYTGSIKDFHYKITPCQEGLQVVVWYGYYNLQNSTVVDEKLFALSREALPEIKAWLNGIHAQAVAQKLVRRPGFEIERGY
ncbi:MAG: hypothetical protein PHG02_00290 [Oscillospiraceae bacterium]|nr:hypothetical protein [Oscillospiraceae bacterium]